MGNCFNGMFLFGLRRQLLRSTAKQSPRTEEGRVRSHRCCACQGLSSLSGLNKLLPLVKDLDLDGNNHHLAPAKFTRAVGAANQAASSWDGQPANLGCFKTLGGARGESSPAVDTQETSVVSFLLLFFFSFLAITGGYVWSPRHERQAVHY